MTNDSGWQTLTNATYFSGTIYYRKVGQMVEIRGASLQMVNAIAANGSQNIASGNALPAGYRPSSPNVVIPLATKRMSSPGIVSISNAGGITIYANESEDVPSGQALYFQTMYFVG